MSPLTNQHSMLGILVYTGVIDIKTVFVNFIQKSDMGAVF